MESGNDDASILSIGDAVWYSLVTITSVGYGDYYPVTTGGKFLGAILVLCSVGLFGYIVGSLGNRVTRYREKKRLGLLGTKMEKHIVIVGWDDFARLVTVQIVNAGHKVAIITNNKNDIDLIRDLYPDPTEVFTLFADLHNLDALKTVNVDDSSCLFLNLTDDTEILVHTLNVQRQYPNKEIVVPLNNQDLKETFHTAGVKYVISKNDIASKLVASFIYEPEVAAFTEDIMASAVHPTNDFDMQQFRVVEGNPYLGKDCGYIFMDMKTRYDAIFMGLGKFKDGRWDLLKNPTVDVKVEKEDYIIMVSNIEARDKVEADFGVEEGKVL